MSRIIVRFNEAPHCGKLYKLASHDVDRRAQLWLDEGAVFGEDCV